MSEEKEIKQGEFVFSILDDRVWVKAWTGGRQRAEVPDQVNGRPVTGILPYAFCGCPSIREAVLPVSMENVGAHAFFNCRSLQSVTFTDQLSQIGDGAFKNDLEFCQVHLVITGKKKTPFRAFQFLMEDMDRRMDAWITQRDGSTAKLVFPFFVVDYEEDYGARVFHEFSYGIGQAYRQCISGDHMDYAGYDRLFSQCRRQETEPVLTDMALGRLRYPLALTGEAADRYRDYLREQAVPAGKRMLKKGDVDAIRFLAREGCFTEQALAELIGEAARWEQIEAASFLMDHRHKTFRRKEKRFEL